MTTRLQYRALVFASLAAVSLASPAWSQRTDVVSPCDPTLARRPGDPLAYALRGERCEGLYIQEVAGTAGLMVASFMEPVGLSDFSPGQPLRVEWSSPMDATVKLRAVALRRRLYYRMDATRHAAGGFDWPVDVLSSLRLRAPEVGVVAWIERPLAGRLERVYLPLRLGLPAVRPEPAGRYVLTLVPGTEVSEVFVSLWTVDTEGGDVAVLQRDVPLRQGPYPAGRGVRISLPALPRAGLYRLSVGAILMRGSPANRTLFFFHPGG